ncbi:protein phosphatase 1 regulatory subunit 36-like [Frankliniella occidentalis]|uniref:Protein phosphatase 1 regulatory subunit 36-like n=1 Tax=Frankliniella occidentalis TaxID=133901 RepID=A0A6J1SSK8_FRAOC|nr:protein phosphatase 1 regulatory subunit 36-like [Frankliniella occidentalis]
MASRVTLARAVRGGSGCLLPDMVVTFQDVVDALDQMRFRRHWQRRVRPGDPDVVTLRDVKDVVLFQVQQQLPSLFLRLFHTPAVDRFLRTLILYLFHYIQVGRDYLALLLGEGAAHRYHHLANGVQSWTHRDARLFEPLLRLAVRVAWVALQRRYLNLIDAEVSRLFRGEPFSAAARRQQRPGSADLRARDRVRDRGLREEVLHGPPGPRDHTLFTRSPAVLELLGRPGHEPPWTLLALGRLPQPGLPEALRRLEAVYTLGEEELAHQFGHFVGILGMPRAQFDVMLNLRDKQRRQELLISSSVGQQISSIFPDGDDLEPSSTANPASFPVLPD